MFCIQLHYLFNMAHYMRLVVQREGGLDLLKVIIPQTHICTMMIHVSSGAELYFFPVQCYGQVFADKCSNSTSPLSG